LPAVVQVVQVITAAAVVQVDFAQQLQQPAVVVV
jgi:hypothetical protein